MLKIIFDLEILNFWPEFLVMQKNLLIKRLWLILKFVMFYDIHRLDNK